MLPSPTLTHHLLTTHQKRGPDLPRSPRSSCQLRGRSLLLCPVTCRAASHWLASEMSSRNRNSWGGPVEDAQAPTPAPGGCELPAEGAKPPAAQWHFLAMPSSQGCPCPVSGLQWQARGIPVVSQEGATESGAWLASAGPAVRVLHWQPWPGHGLEASPSACGGLYAQVNVSRISPGNIWSLSRERRCCWLAHSTVQDVSAQK